MINDTLQYLRNDYLLLTEFVSSLNLEIKKNYSLDVYVHRQFQQGIMIVLMGQTVNA